jgi:hypothetical protein
MTFGEQCALHPFVRAAFRHEDLRQRSPVTVTLAPAKRQFHGLSEHKIRKKFGRSDFRWPSAGLRTGIAGPRRKRPDEAHRRAVVENQSLPIEDTRYGVRRAGLERAAFERSVVSSCGCGNRSNPKTRDA